MASRYTMYPPKTGANFLQVLAVSLPAPGELIKHLAVWSFTLILDHFWTVKVCSIDSYIGQMNLNDIYQHYQLEIQGEVAMLHCNVVMWVWHGLQRRTFCITC